MKFYFTFGLNQTLAHGYVEVDAISADTARVMMVAVYGLVWAFQYEEGDFDPTEYNLIKVPFGTPNGYLDSSKDG